MVQDYIRMSSNDCNKCMSNDIVDFSALKFFSISTKSRKVSTPIQVVQLFFKGELDQS